MPAPYDMAFGDGRWRRTKPARADTTSWRRSLGGVSHAATVVRSTAPPNRRAAAARRRLAIANCDRRAPRRHPRTPRWHQRRAVPGIQPAGGADASKSGASFRRAMTREGYVLKKNGGVRVNATDPTFSAAARPFSGRSAGSIRGAWSRSTRRGEYRDGPFAGGPAVAMSMSRRGPPIGATTSRSSARCASTAGSRWARAGARCGPRISIAGSRPLGAAAAPGRHRAARQQSVRAT